MLILLFDCEYVLHVHQAYWEALPGHQFYFIRAYDAAEINAFQWKHILFGCWFV